MASSLVFLVVVVVGVTSGQRISWGKCPDVPLKRNFDMSKYTGTWYEHVSYPAPWYSSSVTCGYSSFSISDDGSMEVTSGGVDGSGHPYTMTGSANVPNMKVPARLQLRFSRWSTDDYQVIASDYRSFSLVYACSDYAFFRSENVRLLTRQRGEINPKTVKRAYKILRTYGIDSEPLAPMDNGQC